MSVVSAPIPVGSRTPKEDPCVTAILHGLADQLYTERNVLREQRLRINETLFDQQADESLVEAEVSDSAAIGRIERAVTALRDELTKVNALLNRL